MSADVKLGSMAGRAAPAVADLRAEAYDAPPNGIVAVIIHGRNKPGLIPL